MMSPMTIVLSPYKMNASLMTHYKQTEADVLSIKRQQKSSLQIRI